jgi:hypothetical protein
VKNIISVVPRTELFEPEIARHHGRIFKLMGEVCSLNSAVRRLGV